MMQICRHDEEDEDQEPAGEGASEQPDAEMVEDGDQEQQQAPPRGREPLRRRMIVPPPEHEL